MPLLARYDETARISGPACFDGGHMTATLRLAHEQPSGRGHKGGVVIALQLQCYNTCIIDDLEPAVVVTLIDANGNEVIQLDNELPTVPSKRWSWNGNPTRSNEKSLTVNHRVEVKRIQFEFKNRAHGAPVVQVIELGTPIILDVLLLQSWIDQR